jgi:hypothetical protein
MAADGDALGHWLATLHGSPEPVQLFARLQAEGPAYFGAAALSVFVAAPGSAHQLRRFEGDRGTYATVDRSPEALRVAWLGPAPVVCGGDPLPAAVVGARHQADDQYVASGFASACSARPLKRGGDARQLSGCERAVHHAATHGGAGASDQATDAATVCDDGPRGRGGRPSAAPRVGRASCRPAEPSDPTHYGSPSQRRPCTRRRPAWASSRRAAAHLAWAWATRQTDLDGTLRLILRESARLVNCERCGLFVMDTERTTLTARVFDQTQSEVRRQTVGAVRTKA